MQKLPFRAFQCINNEGRVKLFALESEHYSLPKALIQIPTFHQQTRFMNSLYYSHQVANFNF